MSDAEGRRYSLRDAGMVRHTHQILVRASCVTVLGIWAKGHGDEIPQPQTTQRPAKEHEAGVFGERPMGANLADSSAVLDYIAVGADSGQ